MKNRIFRTAIALLCLALILLYASAVFLPHDHERCDSHCIACTVMETGKSIFAGLTSLSLLVALDPTEQLLALLGPEGIFSIKNTPVKLRVKLSN